MNKETNVEEKMNVIRDDGELYQLFLEYLVRGYTYVQAVEKVTQINEGSK